MKKPLQESIHESFQSIQKTWCKAVRSLHSEARSSLRLVEAEAARRFRQLKEQTGLQQSSDEVQRVFADLNRRLQESSESMEKKLDTVFARVKGPLTDELTRLRQKAEHLSRRIESQLRIRSEGQEQGQAGQASMPDDPDTPAD